VETDSANRTAAADGLKKSSFLLWVITIPQAILMFLNLGAYWVIKSEMIPEGRSAAMYVFLFQLLLFTCGTLLYADLKRRNRAANWISAALLLALNILYLWNFVSKAGILVPSSTMPWVLDVGEVIYYQFIFVMPAVFYAALLLSSFKTRLDTRIDTGVSLLLLVTIPVIWYVLFNLAFVNRSNDFSATIVMIFIVVSTLALLLLLLRILLAIYMWAVKLGRIGTIVLTYFVGLIAPLGGLMLNSLIPFPADFQAPAVYILTVINGIILVIPQVGNKAADRALWLARCLTFPFTLYFFLVFLPFLPLSLFAMIAAGTGFLILAPTALFIIHCRCIGDGYVKLWDGAKAVPIVLAVGAALIIPACFTVSAFIDKASLSKAVNYVYSPDYVKQSIYNGSVDAAKNALLKLHNYKEGITVPFISSYYNKIVFNGMVLQDSRVENLYKIFSGEELSKAWSGSGLLRARGRARDMRSRNRVMSSAKTSPVEMVSAEVSDAGSAGYAKKRVTITMKNAGRENSEFNADIKVPPYVVISGYWLKIGNELVPGSIFERKTAMWVYRMIRDSRRDPGLLIYKPDGTLNLSVYPFATSEERVTVIEFMYPSGFSPDIRMGDRDISLGSAPDAEGSVSAAVTPGKGGFLLYIPRGCAKNLPVVRRKPYLHFILDYSKGSGPQAAAYPERIKEICARFPDVSSVSLTAANFEFIDIGTFNAKDQEGIRKAIMACSLQRRGAFLKERAVKRSLLMYEAGMEADTPDGRGFMRYPVFVAVTGKDAVSADEGNFSGFSAIVPEEKGYHVTVTGDTATLGALSADKVVVLRSAGTLAVCEEGGSVAYFGAGDGREMEVYDGGKGEFRPLGVTPAKLPDEKYPLAAQAWLGNIRMERNPSLASGLLKEVVELSKKSGVMVPATAYIVVENESQKRRMELKEKQKLKSSQALSFDENPEEIEPLEASAPSFAVTALCVFLSVVLVRKFRRKQHSLTLPRP